MISPLLFALALVAQDAPTPEAAPMETATPNATVAEAAYPPGAPRDPYGLVAWCYGALSAHKGLRDQVMPEVVRIETTYRRPGTSLEDDLQAYEDLNRLSEGNLALFSRAMEAAEKASPRPINAHGADALRRGRGTWSRAADLPKARLAQEWMSWTLPARCETTAVALEERARLMGPAFDLSAEIEPAAPETPEVPAEATREPGSVEEPVIGG
ncbi:MAG: hypothetical protein Q8L59_05165 [Phenylobacterium sp.]|uniref:hypothetical protein n=1 Tax=Phenylobacterium sp. TaxID=1871053 RepID=UPI002734F61C|nr:hypothetical protein [Phenylobacterium sp.]MDP1641553.1 hypothetical protein [Phenylobacterium sp.]MDP3118254.1 hypothetical protein [Phenylobacterium sp.]MDP3382813.1 hypothetical protein [Phenylobacterium sp.]